jgi:NitT/TauT family transport system ATP-binding protein
MLSVGLHLRMIGRPGRIGALDRILRCISEAIFLGDRIVVMATLPGSIKEVIDVPLAHPRDRSGPQFVALERSIKQLVREEVQKLGVM